MSTPAIIVDYTYKDGVHFFTSGNQGVKGLCVFSADPKKAFDAVSLQLTFILQESGHKNAVVIPGITYAQFYEFIKAVQGLSHDNFKAHPASEMAWVQQPAKAA